MICTKLYLPITPRLVLLCVVALLGCEGTITTATMFADGSLDAPNLPPPARDGGVVRVDGSTAPEPDASTKLEQPPICSIDSLCFAHPSPQAYGLNGGFGGGPESAYLVGNRGTVLHYTEGVFLPIETHANADLLAAYGDGHGTVWVVGEHGTLLEISEQTSQTIALPAELNGTAKRPRLQAVWSTADGIVWIAGTYDDAPLLLRLHNRSFENHSEDIAAQGNISAFFGFAPDDLWATTASGNILHFDGARWTASPTPSNRPLHAISGRGDGELWAAGDEGLLLRRAQLATSEDLTPDASETTWTWERVESGSSHDFVSVLLDVRDAEPPKPPDAGMDARVMDTLETDAGTMSPDPRLHLVDEHGKRSVFSIDSLATQGGDAPPILNLIQLEASRFIAVGEAGYVALVDGDSWAPLSSGTRRNIYALASGPDNAALAVGDTALIEQGKTFLPFDFNTDRTLSAIDCDGSQCWAAGTQGTIIHYDGAASTPIHSVALFGKRLRGIVQIGGTLIVVGDEGLVARLLTSDTDFQILESNVDSDLNAIWARGPNDLWIAGDDGTLLRLSSGIFTPYPMPDGEDPLADLHAVTGDDHTVWAAGNVGTIVRVDVSGVQTMRAGGHRAFNAIAMLDSGHILAAGSGGHVLVSENVSKDGAQWRALESPTDVSLHGIVQTPDSVYIAGLDGVILSSTSL